LLALNTSKRQKIFIKNYSPEIVQILIDECPTLNLNQQNKNGQTALHLAINYKSLNVSEANIKIF
jgi:ankyrin repeat protein